MGSSPTSAVVMNGLLVCESDGCQIWASFGVQHLYENYEKLKRNQSTSGYHVVTFNKLKRLLVGFNANFMRNSPKSSLAMDGFLVCENDGWMAHLGVLWYAKTMRRVCEWYAKILNYWILIQFLFEAHQNSLRKPRSHPRLPSCFKLNPNTNSRDFPLWPWMAHLVVRWCAKTMRVL